MRKEAFNTLISPYLTEKVSNLMQTSNQYAFKVDIKSTKREIKKAIESYFSVEVIGVSIVKVKGKNKRSRFRVKKRPNWKKAYIRLAEGQSIEVGID
mgnify:CR=1 FL=1